VTSDCPFCHPDLDRIFHADQLVLGLWDQYPVSPGHALLIPRRHIADWFQATPEEQDALFRALEIAKENIERDFHPDGFNIGININRPAGQTIFHLHVHLIPRFEGDVIDPTGGVRNVIPSKGNYLLKHASHSSGLVRGGNDPLLPRLLADLNRAKHVDLAVAFVQRSGVKLIYEHLQEGIEKGGRIRLLTGDYLDITDPDALMQLLDLEIDLKVYQTEGTSFHPKAYIFKDNLGGGYAYVGSSNLTSSALGSGIEWNLRIDHKTNQETFAEVCKAFEELFDAKAAISVDYQWVESYRVRRKPDQTRLIKHQAF
jgi:HKD family nuclease